MKHIFAYTLSFVAIAASALLLTKASRAEDPVPPETISKYHAEGGVSTAKDVSEQNPDGSYTITLETFATGSETLVKTSKPSDIILVLDVSSSMDQSDYTYKGQSMRRWRALRAAVLEFVQTIYDNAIECREKDENYLGNRVAIVTYCRNAKLISGGWVDIEQVVSKSGNTYSGDLIDIINTNNTNGVWASNTQGSKTNGTRPDHALDLTIDQLLSGNDDSKRAREKAALTVVLFTDGYPTDNNATGIGEPNTGNSAKFEPPIANKTLYYASIIKKTYKAKFYSIGLISTPTQQSDNDWQWRNYKRVDQMMDWLSSNYQNAAWNEGVVNQNNLYIENAGSNGNHYDGYDSQTTTMNFVWKATAQNGNPAIPAPWQNAWTYNSGVVTLNQFTAGTRSSDKDENGNVIDYSTIVNDNTSFDSVFQSIASSSGGSTETIGSTTQVRDVVSSSFVLPEGAASDLSKINLKIYTEDIKSDASTWINRTQLYPVSGTPSVSPSIVTTTDGHEALYVEGFDYSKDDDDETGELGNWVGVRYDEDGLPFYAGKKLVIQFDIRADGEATGGEGTNTNTSDSGVYIKLEDGTYKNINHYDIPHTTIPINIVITKTGLRHGESATFQILYAPILRDANGVIQYNALGKAKPDEDHWEDFSKVIITNKGNNGAAVTKTLLSLDPGFVYKVTEDKWGWAYTMTGQGGTLTTAEVEVNPFSFNNEEKENAVKHAEAVTVNHFESPAYGGSKEEHYKSSKVESF